MNFTEKDIERLKASKERQTFRDDSQPGFGLRIESLKVGGRKSYFFNAKVGGRVVFKAIGEVGRISVKDARDKAKMLAAEAVEWKEKGFPAVLEGNSFSKSPAAETQGTGAPTFRQLTERYILHHLHDPKAKINHPDKAERELRWALGKYFEGWMEKRVDEITLTDVIQLRDAAAKTPYVANRNVQCARALLGWCSAGKDGKINVWELPGNPAARVELYPEKERERYLLPKEQVILEDTLEDKRTHPDLRDFVLLALDTAARKKSILLMEWTEIDFDLGQWTIPANKSKSGKSYIVDLLPRALKTLKRRHDQRTTHPLVFPPISGQYLHLDKPFRRLMARIGGTLSTLRIHDLRRSTGSAMAQAGESLEKIAKALGQESVAATSIYARLSSASVREAREAGDRKSREQMAIARKRMKANQVRPITSKPAKELTAGR